MSLHDRIMELPTQDRHLEDWSNTRMAWLAGFDTGLHEAAQLAKEADELMAEMAAVLESASVGAVVIDSAKDVLDKYDDWKESTK